MMQLRPYQEEARAAVLDQWDGGTRRTLLVLVTGGGKTIIFSKIIEDVVRRGDRALVLAHRGELLDQAADKLRAATGLTCAVEKAEESCLGAWNRVVVGSVQSMMRASRLDRFAPDYFGTIVVDEAHHAISDGYQRVLSHFPDAKVLGVTATPDRGDMKNLGEYFDSLAYEYTLPRAIKEGYLSKIRAMTIPLTLDIAGVSTKSGDYNPGELGTALDPYLYQIADEMAKVCMERKTVVFLPLIKTSQKFRDILIERGFRASEVNGESLDRAEILQAFDLGETNVLCNSMLLCLDAQTEILTDRGFVGIDDMSSAHKVANWCFDGTVFFEEPKEIVRRPLHETEHMVSIDSSTINLRVTNTHRMIVGSGVGLKDWKKISADELARHKLPAYGTADPFYTEVGQAEYQYTKHAVNNTVYHLMQTGKYDDRDDARAEALRRKEERATLRYANPSELTIDDCRLIGFWIADGSAGHPKRGGVEYTLCQSSAYPNIIRWVDALIGRLGIHSIKRNHAQTTKTEQGYVTWHIPRGTGHGKQARKGIYYLEPYLRKHGTPLFWGLNEPQFDALIEGYWYGDGNHGDAKVGMPKSIYANDTKKEWIDLLCAIGSVRGWRCRMSEIPQRNNKHATQYGIRMIKGGNLYISENTEIIHETYKPENVWCVRTTSKNIITRRNGRVTVMGNTEGWDCPSVDCIVVLRPTKIRSLYCQMVGRGTRLFPGKDHLLILDFLWHTQKHELCRPAHLICQSEDVAQKMTEKLAECAGSEDIMEAEEGAKLDVVASREEALAKELAAMKKRKRALVDPLQFEMSIQAEDLSAYVPAFGWECAPPSDKQKATLEKLGILPDEIDSAGKAAKMLDRLDKRRTEGLTTPKQIRFLEGKGFLHVGTWSFESAKKLIDRIAGNGWVVPRGINPREYRPS